MNVKNFDLFICYQQFEYVDKLLKEIELLVDIGSRWIGGNQLKPVHFTPIGFQHCPNTTLFVLGAYKQNMLEIQSEILCCK